MLAGLVPCEPSLQIARRLAENRCRVLVPALVNRRDEHSVTWAGRGTNQPHREFVYRPAFELGRHIIGYEVQKVLAAVDWFSSEPQAGRQIGVFGYGEGGLVALYAAAADRRIAACCTSGYFDSRQDLWQEPIYRNVFGLLQEFGDAEIASLVAPRALIVEACAFPKVDGPPPPREGRGGAAPGRIVTPPLARVEAEFARAQGLVKDLKLQGAWQLVTSGEGTGLPGSDAALQAFLGALISDWKLQPPGSTPSPARNEFDIDARHKRQLDQLLEHTQYALAEAEYVRTARYAGIDRTSVEKWQEAMKGFRAEFYNDVIGRFEDPLLPPNPRSRQIYDEPKFTGYEVVLDVFPDVFAYGMLLVPKGIKDGERRPVVVCQHGLEGRPTDVADPKVDHPAYHTYACKLAERGFITFAPQNPYIFRDRFRTLQRKANPLKKTLFSIIVRQHEQITAWLAGLPMVDPQRIAFYGLSYGGKTAMRVPPLVDRYCLSICSADFNEWIWKNASLRSPYSYVGTIEYEIFEFNLGNTFNYAEMAGLIAPRPFMVERGHKDGVAPDSQVAYEFAKVRHLYADLGLSDRVRIEFFNGPHTIHGVGTLEFLHEHLKWPGEE
jgi:dienelactone hydrolase